MDDPVVVGGYRLVGRLGVGGMGRVFLGLSPGGRAVAVKVVHPELARDPAFRLRFGREVAVARRVNGAFTAPVVEAGPDDRPPWVAFGYVAGPTLAEAVEVQRAMPPRVVWWLAGGLVEALRDIHGCGLVHRDLKPQNVILAADGPRVIDFGIAHAAEGGHLTPTGAVLGTPGYMSPEQAQGRPVGPASDVFALGGVLAFAATGRPPFGDGLPGAVLYRVVHADPSLDGLPGPLRDLVAACLAKTPASRPTLADVLALVAAHRGDAAGQWPAGVARLIRGRQDLSAATTARVGGDPGLAATLVAGQSATRVESRPPHPRPDRRRGPRYLAALAVAAAVAAILVSYLVVVGGPAHQIRRVAAPSVPLAVTVEPDGGRFVAVGWDASVVRGSAVRAAAPTSIVHLPVPRPSPTTDTVAAISPDGRTVAIVQTQLGDVPTVGIYDSTTGASRGSVRPAPVNGESVGVRELAFSPDGRTLAVLGKTLSSGPLLTEWSLPSDQLLGSVAVDDPGYRPDSAPSISADGRVAVGNGDRVWVWDSALRHLATTITYRSTGGGIPNVQISPDGQFVAAVDSMSVRVWRTANSALLVEFPNHQTDLDALGHRPALRFSGDGRLLAVSADGSAVRLWQLSTQREIARFDGGHEPVEALSFAPDGRTLAAGMGGDGAAVIVWDLSWLRPVGSP